MEANQDLTADLILDSIGAEGLTLYRVGNYWQFHLVPECVSQTQYVHELKHMFFNSWVIQGKGFVIRNRERIENV